MANPLDNGGSLQTCLICDDHAMMREALAGSIRLGWPDADVAQAEDFPSAWAGAARQPELILCDLGMPGASPADGIKGMREAAPDTPLLVITGVEDDVLLLQLFDMGISGFLPKKSTSRIIEAAIRLVLAGGNYVPSHVVQMASARGGSAPPVKAFTGDMSAARLSNRQLCVMEYIAQGKTDKEIARELEISPVTVKAHAAAAMAALGASNRAEAVGKATRMGLIGG